MPSTASILPPLAEAKTSKPDVFARISAASQKTKTPFLSLALFLVFAGVFAAELKYGVDAPRGTAPSLRTLIAFGGVSRELFLSGEWWRLFTAPLLHGNLEHLLSNGIVFLIAGWMLEPLIGRRWFGASFVLGAVGGSIASISLNQADVVSVGASGGIMGLLAMIFICSFGDTVNEKSAKRMRWFSLRLLLPALLPLATASHIDVSAHLGGAISGGCLGFLAQMFWPSGSDRPALTRATGAIAVSGATAAVIAFGLTATHFGTYSLHDDGLIPFAALPATESEGIAQSSELVDRYPNDPRGHMYLAMHFLTERDLTDADEQLRAAEALRDKAPVGAPGELEFLLAMTQVYEGKLDAARTAPQSACDFAATHAQSQEDDATQMASMLDKLRDSGVCR